VIIGGFRELGTEFAEFRWCSAMSLARSVNSARSSRQGRRLCVNQQEIILMHFSRLRQLERGPRHAIEGIGPVPVRSPDDQRAAELDATGVPVGTDSPYPGLQPFGPRSADLFFGRRQLTAALVSRLVERMADAGPLVGGRRFGLRKDVAAQSRADPVRRGRDFPAAGSRHWPLESFTPTGHPLDALAIRIAQLARGPPASSATHCAPILGEARS